MVVVSEPEDRFFDDPFFARVLRGAHTVLSERGQQLVFVVKAGDSDTERFLNFASGGHIDGALLVSLHGKDPLPARLQELGVPVVLNGRPLVPGSATPYVDADNRGGARTATAHLVQRGIVAKLQLIDCQLPTAHLRSLGSKPMSRGEFSALVAVATSGADVPLFSTS